MEDIFVPASGMAMEDVLLVEWLKRPGDEVAAGEAVAVVETDKATVELTATGAGQLGRHLFEAGQRVEAGATVARLLGPDETEPPETEPPETVAAEAAGHRRAPHRLGPWERSSRAAVGADGLSWLARMLLIRRFEERAEALTVRGRIPGGVHPAAGQEATAVGVASALRPGDTVSASHRGHHHALARGMSPNALMAELFGKATGVSGGKGGSMHLVDFSIGFIGSNGIVGASVGVALGDAFAARYRDQARVAVAFFGDGGINTGRTWESINLAGAWRLPLIAVCENNLYAVETPTASVMGGASMAERASGFGVAAVSVDGQDIVAVHEAANEARSRAVEGGGATFIESRTYRYSGHGSGEAIGGYRSVEEVEEWRDHRDPITRLKDRLVSSGQLSADRFAELDVEARETVDAAVDFAERSPWPGS